MTLQALLDNAHIEPADAYLARHLLRLDPNPPQHLDALIALACAQLRQGNTCLPLDAQWLDEWGIRIDPNTLAQSKLIGRHPEEQRPLILEDGFFYLARYHAWEIRIVEKLYGLRQGGAITEDTRAIRHALDATFGARDNALEVDWQRVAAAIALKQRFCVISGGPGTGKTYTVARILRLLQTFAQDEALRIALAAPTGKAASRLSESIRQAEPGLLDAIGKAQTLHRLLGMRPHRVRPRYHARYPLPVDVLIVDEVSMVDLPMMARMLDALPEHARLILLGDHYQLASVDAGQIMADLCAQEEVGYSIELADFLQQATGESVPRATKTQPLTDHIVILRHSRRFDPEKGIGRLADAVNRGQSQQVLKILKTPDPIVHWHDNSRPITLQAVLQTGLLPEFSRLETMRDPKAALLRLNEVRLLCALREGPQGTQQLNRRIAQWLGHDPKALYPGKPVMVMVNDYRQRLFNGDVGLVLPDEEGQLRVWFLDDDNRLRAVLPMRLPAHETVYAMTVHKSQGSEAHRVILVLPEQDNPLVTRELVYTGITRAREQLIVCAKASVLERAIERRVHRFSGLRRKLWA